MPSPLPPFPRPRATTPDQEFLRAQGIRLRAAEAGDLPVLAHLHALSRQAELLLAPWSTAEKQAFLDQQFALQHSHFVRHFSRGDFWAVTDAAPGAGAAPIGRYYLDRSPPSWRMVDLLIAPEWQGKAIGTALIRWTQQQALAAGADGLDLHVLVSNPRAKALYERLGFIDVPGGDGVHLPMHWVPGGA